jgi:hypothetical protein
MRKLIPLLLAIVCFGMIGCSKNTPYTYRCEINDTIAADESGIVFFRSAMFDGRLLAYPVIEVNIDLTFSLVTILQAGEKFLYKTKPGQHSFFVVPFAFGQFELMIANMDAGKTYYVDLDVKSVSETWIAGRLTPDVAKPSFRRKLLGCKWIQNTPEAQQWFAYNKESLRYKAEVALMHSPKNIIPSEYGTTTPVR